jgi:predicted nucleic acid-binding protein
MDRSMVQAASRLAAELALRGADALYVAGASRLGCPLATLDIEQQEMAAGVVSIARLEIR